MTEGYDSRINRGVVALLFVIKCDPDRFRTGTKTGSELGVKLGSGFVRGSCFCAVVRTRRSVDHNFSRSVHSVGPVTRHGG